MPPTKRTRKRPSKAEQERREAQAAKDAGEEVQPTEMANGVIITRSDDGQGNIGLETAPLGDVKITEIPTILAMAKRQLEQRLGIAE